MPPHSYLEWIAGANVPRPRTARPKRRIFAEYETDDEDEEVEFVVRSNKSAKKSKDKDGDEKKSATKEPSLKQALKKVAATTSDVSDSALSSDKEVETSGSEAEVTSASASASSFAAEYRSKDIDPACPCRRCVRAQKALRRSRHGKKAKRVSFSDDEDDSDASDDVETVHNFFKWDQAMEAKKARDQDAKNYKEYLADKAKKVEAAIKEAEKKKEDDLREQIKKEEEKKKQEENTKEEENKKKNEQERGKGKQGKSKDKKADSSSKETAETSNSEADTTKEGTDVETSDAGSQKEGISAAKASNKKPSKASLPPPEPDESDSQETTAIRLLMEQLLKKQKKDKSKKKMKRKDKEREEPDPEKTFSHPARSHDPNWLIPPRSSIVHVEHSMEAPTDPRPNAFFDDRNGVMRVYHGPNYGNPTGALYQKQGLGATSSPHALPQRRIFDNKDHNGYASHFPLQPYETRTGYPPPHSAVYMPEAQEVNPNPWFQGSGTTVVPGTPAGGQQNPELAKPSIFPTESHSFIDLTNRIGKPPYDTNYPNASRGDQRTYFKPAVPTQSPGFNPAYFHASAAANSTPFNNTTPGLDVQNAKSVNTSSTPSNFDQDALIAKEMAELKARENGFIGGNQNGQFSDTTIVPPIARTSPQKSNEAVNTTHGTSTQVPYPNKDVNKTDAWNNPASSTPIMTNNDDWDNAGNAANTNAASLTWGNSGGNDTTGNNNSPPKTSPTYSNNGNYNNNDNKVAGSFQNVSDWFSQPSASAQNSMPGAYPSPSMVGFAKNDCGSADWDTSQDNNAERSWGDPTAANTSGGFWESAAEDAGKEPSANYW